MKATGEDILMLRAGDGIDHQFEYYTWSLQQNYKIIQGWVRKHIGAFGKDYYYNRGKWWFKTPEDLLAFKLRFGNE